MMKQLKTYSNETKQILQKIPDLAKHIVSGVKPGEKVSNSSTLARRFANAIQQNILTYDEVEHLYNKLYPNCDILPRIIYEAIQKGELRHEWVNHKNRYVLQMLCLYGYYLDEMYEKHRTDLLTILILKGYKWETTIPEYLALKRGTYNPLGFFADTVLVAQKARRINNHGRQGFEITRNKHKRNIYGFYLSEDGVELSNKLIETQVNFCEFNERLAKEINIKTQKVRRE